MLWYVFYLGDIYIYTYIYVYISTKSKSSNFLTGVLLLLIFCLFYLSKGKSEVSHYYHIVYIFINVFIQVCENMRYKSQSLKCACQYNR